MTSVNSVSVENALEHIDSVKGLFGSELLSYGLMILLAGLIIALAIKMAGKIAKLAVICLLVILLIFLYTSVDPLGLSDKFSSLRDAMPFVN